MFSCYYQPRMVCQVEWEQACSKKAVNCIVVRQKICWNYTNGLKEANAVWRLVSSCKILHREILHSLSPRFSNLHAVDKKNHGTTSAFKQQTIQQVRGAESETQESQKKWQYLRRQSSSPLTQIILCLGLHGSIKGHCGCGCGGGQHGGQHWSVDIKGGNETNADSLPKSKES